MADLYAYLSLMLGLSVCLGILTHRWAKDFSPFKSFLLMSAAVFFLVVNATYLRDGLWITHLMTTHNVIILGNWQPLAVGVLVGAAWSRFSGYPLRRIVLLPALVAACLYQSYSYLPGDPPPVADRWHRGVCIQTTQSTCSPAAAATLLSLYDIETTEEEMARLCLTRANGTSMLGLYRGLKLKTQGTPWDVEVVTADFHGLQQLDSPTLITVGIEFGQRVDERYTNIWGWAPGVRHTVVLLGWEENRSMARIADPSVGREKWFAEGVQDLYRGCGFRLVQRK